MYVRYCIKYDYIYIYIYMCHLEYCPQHHTLLSLLSMHAGPYTEYTEYNIIYGLSICTNIYLYR